MRWRVLGPVGVWDGHTWMSVPAGKQRELLAILLLHPGQLLERVWLVETLWDGSGPPSAGRLLAHYVWRLRGLLGHHADRLRTVPSGYLLAASDDELDHQRFGQLLALGTDAAREGDPRRATRALTEAIALWHGPALADARTQPVLLEAARRLDQQRVVAREALADALLAVGRPADALVHLEELTADEPYREASWRLLMLALYRVGRRVDALAAYQRLWRFWTDQLGIEPSHELRDLHQRLLADDPSLTTVPTVAATTAPANAWVTARQLPTAVPHFVGRAAQIKELSGLLDTDGGVTIFVIGGTAGVGKTTLALHLAHRVAADFPDGQLYVNLRGFDPAGTIMTSAEALHGFLNALGTPPQRIPVGLDAQAALYRSLLSGRRMLVVLDNAHDSTQVRPLLPGAPGCLVLVTSRNDLSGLVAADGAHPLGLDLLPREEAHELLARRIGFDRVAGEPGAVDEIITRTARLPLALTIVAARAATHPRFPLATLAAELADARDRWNSLTGDDPGSDVRTVLSWSFRTLTAGAGQLFRLLGLHPGPDISAPAAASLAGLSLTELRPRLAELTRAHLLTEHLPGRYKFHDLLRAYAADLARAHEPEDGRQAAIHRMLDHYLHSAYAADRMLDEHRDRITLVPPRRGVVPEVLADYRQALAWFTAERAVLLATVDQAAGSGSDSYAWQLAWTLTPFLDRQGHWHEWITTQQAGLDAARRVAHLPGQAHAHVYLGRAHAQLGLHDLAHAHHRQAHRLYTELGHRTGHAYTHISAGMMAGQQGHHQEALDHTQQALDLYLAAGNSAGQARALNNIGWYLIQLGHHQKAITCCQQALALHRKIGHRYDDAATWNTLAHAHDRLGHHQQAIDCFHQALRRQRHSGWRNGQASTLNSLGDTYHTVGNQDAARQAWQQALDILDQLHHPDADHVRAKLGAANPQAT
ncbi:BTAD domain-containing putative transcriptional regulator [Phytohabitans sp. LJ34]|uniref:AfsR/SARP family transcriptional regulator n=1 Tax=Phytohabitans sp. LJ34 TaxID=3452217 RepID=UPI003F8CC574